MDNEVIPLDEDQPLNLDDVEGDEFTEVDVYDPKVKARAYSLYLNTGMSLTDIAMETGVRTKVIASWARRGKWRVKKQEIENELMNRAADGYRALIIKHRAPTVERHLRVAEKLEKGIERVIDAETADPDVAPDGKELRRMADALSAATGVSARAAAINDRTLDSMDQGGQQQGKVPLVAIGIQVSKSEGSEKEPIEVKVTEPTDD